jgi:hypothetical protein
MLTLPLPMTCPELCGKYPFLPFQKKKKEKKETGAGQIKL